MKSMHGAFKYQMDRCWIQGAYVPDETFMQINVSIDPVDTQIYDNIYLPLWLLVKGEFSI